MNENSQQKNSLNYTNRKQIAIKNSLLSDGISENLNQFEMPPYFNSKISELFDPKIKGSQIFRKIFKYDNYNPPIFDSKKMDEKKLIRIKLCQGDELEALKAIQNKFLPRKVLNFKARIILGKTQFNDQCAQWTKEYISQ